MNNYTNVLKYKIIAPVYDVLLGNRLFTGGRKRALDLLELKPGERVLLSGVGTGLDLRFLPRGIHAVGIDISEAMLSKAKKSITDADVRLFRMNVEELGFEDESFDAVVMNLILSVVENPGKAMAEAVRVLKKNGRIIVFDKFIADRENPSFPRKVLNIVTSLIGTDINRRFGDISGGLPIRVVCDMSSIFGGSYRIILLRSLN